MKVRLPNNGGGNMNQMLRQAQQMQQDMQNLQADLEEREFSATAGGGLVEVTVDGKHLIKNIKIRNTVNILCVIFTAFMVVGRLVCGVHWFTDILGGLIFSVAMILLYCFANNFVDLKKEKTKILH